MHSVNDSQVTVELFKRYLEGDEAAATTIYDRFADRLRQVAMKQIGSRLGQRTGADDALQSAFRTFFVRARNGQFSVSQSGQLWRLLARITDHKIMNLAEKHTAACRDMRREAVAGFEHECSAKDGLPEVVVILQDEIDSLVEQLSPRDGEVLCLWLTGASASDIGKLVTTSVSTVRRVIARVKRQLEHRLIANRTDGKCESD